jgi:hypothetical protein
MGRLVTNNAMSINGAFEAPSPDEWLVLDPDSNNVSLEQFLVADAMLLGRKTYEGLAAVWPQLVDDPTLGMFADRLNSMPKYVASRTLREPLQWNATLLKGDLAESVTALKKTHLRTRYWRPAVAKAGLGVPVRVHDLRHAHASWLLAGGADLKTVMDHAEVPPHARRRR